MGGFSSASEVPNSSKVMFVAVGTRLLQRFKRNVDFLCNIVDRDPLTSGNYAIARAGLRYVTECDDVINDAFGLVVFLDDNFIVQQAVVDPDSQARPYRRDLETRVPLKC